MDDGEYSGQTRQKLKTLAEGWKDDPDFQARWLACAGGGARAGAAVHAARRVPGGVLSQGQPWTRKLAHGGAGSAAGTKRARR